ncbi:MAG: DedA family protein [Acidiferrobacterales bacterium]|nr:DedA family protein [Acidiferrobacterales bacterium]
MELGGLFLSALLSATVLPGGSEAILVYLDSLAEYGFWTLLAVASAGNTLGGMTSYLLGRIFPKRRFTSASASKAIAGISRYGPPLLLLSWVPVIGDGLCVAAGWLRINWLLSAILIGAGKTARYAVVLVVL